jgi:hypothetical protein
MIKWWLHQKILLQELLGYTANIQSDWAYLHSLEILALKGKERIQAKSEIITEQNTSERLNTLAANWTVTEITIYKINYKGNLLISDNQTHTT